DGNLCTDVRNNCDDLAHPTSGRQVFVYDAALGVTRQVTRGPGDCLHPQISPNGNWIVFDSTTDLTGNGPPSATADLYQGLLKPLGPTCPQLPCPPSELPALTRWTTTGGHHGIQNFNGGMITFESNAGAPTNVQKIYRLDRGVLSLLSDPAIGDAREHSSS